MRPSRLWVGTIGLLALVAPRFVLSLHSKVNLFGFRNTEELEPTEWLVSLTRIGGVIAIGMALLGSEPDVEDAEDAEKIDFV